MSASPETDGTPGSVLVVGSANVDATVRLDAFPRPGETVFGTAAGTGLGGKGANQAVAAAMTGADTSFVGAVGDDADGALVRRTLVRYGVDTAGLRVAAGAVTGRAHITVDATAENTIVVVSGANAELTPQILDAPETGAVIDRARPVVGLTQGELRADTVDAFAVLCRRRGIRFVLNLAPVIPVRAATLRMADPLVVNEHEAAALLGGGLPADTMGVAEAEDAARRLCGDVAASVVITLGAAGAVAADAGTVWHEPAPRVARVVDTTGAGDAFVGALAAFLARGDTLHAAVRGGVAAGSASAGAVGTVASYDRLRTLDPVPRRSERVR